MAAELLQRYPRCKILLMVSTKPLALQHRDSALRHLKLGEDCVVAVTVKTGGRGNVWENPAQAPSVST